MSQLTDVQIRLMINRYIRKKLDSWDSGRFDGRLSPFFEVQEDLEQVDELITDCDIELRENQLGSAAITLQRIFEEEQVPLPPEGIEFNKACREFLKSTKKMYMVEKNRINGEYGDDIEKMFPVSHASISEPVLMKSANDLHTPKLLQEIWDEYKSDKVKALKWRLTTIRNHEPKFQSLLQFFGNVPVSKISKTMIGDYRRLLDNLPPSFQLKGYKDLSKIKLSDIEGKHSRTMDITTVREYMNLINALFEFAKDCGYVQENPVRKGFIPPKKGKVKDQRLPFTDPTDLDLIFKKESYLKWSEDRPERFWVPILALYTGARMEELTQLEVLDIRQVEGIWCLDIKGLTSAAGNEEIGAQMLKNENSPRIIPLHPFLVDQLKFPDYVQEVGKDGRNLIFSNLKKDESTNFKYSHGLSKDFGRYIRNKAGIQDPKKTFHSFRHTVANHLYNVPVLGTMIEELEGRAVQIQQGIRYAKGYNVPVLYKEAILKMGYKVDLSHLKNSKYIYQG